jgi:hypothetical protein
MVVGRPHHQLGLDAGAAAGLGDERLTTGLLDRLTFRSHILEFIGESYRLGRQLEMHQPPYAESDEASTFDSPKVAKARPPKPE